MSGWYLGHQGPVSGPFLEMTVTGQVWASSPEGLCALYWRPLPFITPTRVAALVPTLRRSKHTAWKCLAVRRSHRGHADRLRTQRGLRAEDSPEGTGETARWTPAERGALLQAGDAEGAACVFQKRCRWKRPPPAPFSAVSVREFLSASEGSSWRRRRSQTGRRAVSAQPRRAQSDFPPGTPSPSVSQINQTRSRRIKTRAGATRRHPALTPAAPGPRSWHRGSLYE